MKYTKIVPGGIYERHTARGILRGTMITATVRSGGTVTGELRVPGFPDITVGENNVEDFGNWRYVGGGVGFDGYSLPDPARSAMEQMFEADDKIDVENLSWNSLREKAKLHNVPIWKRSREDIESDLLARLQRA